MSLTFQNLWLCMDALAAALACDQCNAEEVLDAIEAQVRGMDAHGRSGVRRKMICIVAQLSRLEVRMMTSDGHMRPPI